MELKFLSPELHALDSTPLELIACGVYSDERPLGGIAGALDWRLGGRLSQLTRETYLKGELDEVVVTPGRPQLPFDKVLILGLGPRDAMTEAVSMHATKRLLTALEGMNVRRAVVELPGRSAQRIGPVRAVELLLDLAGRSLAHDVWWLVEPASDQEAITSYLDRRRHERR